MAARVRGHAKTRREGYPYHHWVEVKGSPALNLRGGYRVESIPRMGEWIRRLGSVPSSIKGRSKIGGNPEVVETPGGIKDQRED
jgi:hypothetical protein